MSSGLWTTELACGEPGLPEGQELTVLVQPLVVPGTEGILRSAGACIDEADDLDAYLQWNREQRKHTRTLDPS